MQGFKHKFPVQIRFKDMDKMGHVNNANYLSYIEMARLSYLTEVIGKDSPWSQQLGIILARVEIDYRMPVFLHDEIAVYTACTRLGSKSFDLSWKIVRQQGDEEQIVSEGLAVLVCYDYSESKTIKIPEQIKAKFTDYEGM